MRITVSFLITICFASPADVGRRGVVGVGWPGADGRGRGRSPPWEHGRPAESSVPRGGPREVSPEPETAQLSNNCRLSRPQVPRPRGPSRHSTRLPAEMSSTSTSFPQNWLHYKRIKDNWSINSFFNKVLNKESVPTWRKILKQSYWNISQISPQSNFSFTP